MSDRSEQILVWAPRGRDGALAVQLIDRHHLSAVEVSSADEIIEGLAEVGCAVIAAEALTAAIRARLTTALATQPPWSDFPIILFAPRGLDRTDDALDAVKQLGNVSILDRPIHSGTFISALTAALRGRRRQYEARTAILRRDQFLAMLGHELRNPLAAITLAIETIPVGHDSPGDRQRAVIARQARHLARLVDDLLDVARVTSGKVRLQTAPLDLTKVAERCVQGAELAARSRGVELASDLSPQPIYIDGDLVRVEEIFNNLIANALKYSEQGTRVTVRTRREGSRAIVEIADTGIGIAPEMLERVFDLFAQADGSLDRSQGGLGIGLTLVRSLVQLHEGTITAHSAGLGHGSTFVVEFPISRNMARSEVPHLVSVPARQTQRVLLVEDNPDVLEMTRELLVSLGCDVKCAADGEEGLAALLAWRPDIAFVDIGIPKLDGFGLATQARQRGIDSFLVAMTGYGQPEDRKRALEAGFDRHATKPVTSVLLQQMIGLAAKSREPASSDSRHA